MNAKELAACLSNSIEVANMDTVGRLSVAIKRIAALQGLVQEIDVEIDRQIYNEPYVKSARENDLDIPHDCEHNIILKEELRNKIRVAANPT